MDDKKKKRYEVKANELVFTRQKLEFHNKVQLIAMEEFSRSFTKFIKNLDDGDNKSRLKKMMGLGPPEQPENPTINLSKAGQNARKQRQNQKEKAEETH